MSAHPFKVGDKATACSSPGSSGSPYRIVIVTHAKARLRTDDGAEWQATSDRWTTYGRGYGRGFGPFLRPVQPGDEEAIRITGLRSTIRNLDEGRASALRQAAERREAAAANLDDAEELERSAEETSAKIAALTEEIAALERAS